MRIQTSGDPWKSLWAAIAAQFAMPGFSGEDRLVLVLGNPDQSSMALRDLAERAVTSTDASEWEGRQSSHHKRVLKAVQRALPAGVNILELFRRTSVEVLPLNEVERAFERRRLGTAFALPSRFLSVLRDVAGGGARRRALFLAAALRTRLAKEFGIDVVEPAEWGLPAYRSMIERLSRIEIPGTGVSGSSEDLFVWPLAKDLDRSTPKDFEDEAPASSWDHEGSSIDLRSFPSHQIERCVIVAGPGYGKSALLNAVAARLARTPYVPVFVPLGSFAASDISVLEFLSDEVNRELAIRVDWMRLSEQGIAVLLFDGLDEIPAAKRRAVLERIATFSARHPLAPWLLTVRDPAVFSSPLEGRMIELLPLGDSDVVRFADAMKSRVAGLDSWQFARRIEAYPDTARLARIPLFLTMLLALSGPGMKMPTSRADLIETYLKTLFSPHEHKSIQVAPSNSIALRKVAEAIAYAQLENQEIGATEREVLEVAAKYGSGEQSPDTLLENLSVYGVLRRQSAIRLQFPYPIVQEYLAACHLVREQPQMLSKRIEDAIQRPWAQVVQFALELHPQPSPIIREMLAREDDAFFTGLRLVARCIVNGARVEAELRNEVARRLAPVWAKSTWRIAERVGHLVVDGFSQPLLPELRKVMGNRWLVHHGVGEIITRANDPVLTKEVIASILDRGLDRYTYLHPLQSAIDRLGDDVLVMYIDKVRDQSTSDEQLIGLANLVGELNCERITVELALNLACDKTLPDELRLEAFSIAGETLDPRALPIIKRALHSGEYRSRWAALDALAKSSSFREAILGYLRDDSVELEVREEIAVRSDQVFKTSEDRKSFFRECVSDLSLPGHLRGIMLTFLARHGDEHAFLELIEKLSSSDSALAGATIALFGHYPIRELGISAADIVRARVTNAREAVAFANNAVIGMTYLFEMNGFGSGILKSAPPHPAFDVWADLVEGWMDRDEGTDIQKMKITIAAIGLGSLRAVGRLENLVLKIEDPDDARFDEEDELGHTIGDAIDQLRRKHIRLPRELLEKFARCKRANVPYAGVRGIAAWSDYSALELLVSMHNDPNSSDIKSVVSEAIEPLASRLGVTILRSGRSLKMAAHSEV